MLVWPRTDQIINFLSNNTINQANENYEHR